MDASAATGLPASQDDDSWLVSLLSSTLTEDEPALDALLADLGDPPSENRKKKRRITAKRRRKPATKKRKRGNSL